ncbi:hypothetical protein [Burkholderia cepacia]|uniref:hypothetical protein n=1 Tax=Burkholderia cepacia TaxID=292 RepID=UPI00158BDF01|nr:hypothetical protein [Burkholderia cepacia]
MKKIKILLSLIAVGLVGAIVVDNIGTKSKPSNDDLFGDTPIVANKTPQIDQKPAVDPSNQSSATTTQASSNGGSEGSKTVSASNVKSTSRRVAIEEFNKQNYYESIVSEVEGFRSTLYHDNIGGAIGNGWNVSLQSRNMNQKITQGINLSPSDSMALVSLSGNKHPSNFPSVSITPEQATKAAQIMRLVSFEPVVVKALGQSTFNKLKPNQQAVAVYHAYKTGNLNWKNLKASIIQCANTQSKEACSSAGSQFTYSYMLNGTRMYDKRSNLYMNALFTNPADYGYLLGLNNASPDFQGVAKSSEIKIDTSKPADEQVDSQDDFGKAKQQMIDQGKSFDLQIIVPNGESIESTPKPIIKNNNHGVGVYLS